MDDISVTEIIDIFPTFRQGIVEKISNFCEMVDLWENDLTKCKLNMHGALEEVNVVENQVRQIMIKFEDKISKNEEHLVKLKNQMDTLTDLENSLKADMKEKQRKRDELNQLHLKLEKKKNSLMEKRDKIQALKVLTNTSFVLSDKEVSGYTVCYETKQVKPFEFHSRKYSREDISNLLYDNLLSHSQD